MWYDLVLVCAVVMWCDLVLVCVLVTGEVVRAAPNIIVIIADDLGWNDVSFHGSSQIVTPNIDALAYQGVILNRHYTQPSCSPSRGALLTGRYPIRTGLHFPIGAGTTAALPLNFTLLPQHLNKLGYQSHLVGKWHLGSHRSEYLPTRRGFHSHFGFLNGFLNYYDGLIIEQGVAGIDAWRDGKGAWQEFVGHYLTDLFAQEAVSVIRAHNRAKGPLYLQVALSAPHTGNKGDKFQVVDITENDHQHSHIADPLRKLYAGMVTAMDDSVGVILEALQRQGLLNDSIVLFISDNGAPTLDPVWQYDNRGSNWPLRGMKMSCHDGGVRNVGILWSPLVTGGRVSEQLIHITDWLPTFYSAAGGDVRDLGPLDGVNQWTALRGSEAVNTRSELLVDMNPVSGNEALIRWPWKIVKYSSINSIQNTHAGETGRGPEVPTYPLDKVINSRAAKALSLQPSEYILVLRAQASSLDTRCRDNNSSATLCDNQYCLFNLETDPCEATDLYSIHTKEASTMQAALIPYKEASLLIPVPKEYTLAPQAHPRFWEGYWAPWADSNTPSKSVSLFHTCFTPSIAVSLLLLFIMTV